MKPAFVKKNTEGGAGGLIWEAGEVKALNPYAADELVRLAPGDYEIVQEGEYIPDPPAHNPPGFSFPVLSTDGTGIEVIHPGSTVVEVAVEDVEPSAAPAVATKPRGVAKKSNKTETPSAE